MYKKQSYPTPGTPSNQLSLFKSFVKSIKSADQTAAILPIRSAVKIYPLSTTDQITTLEHVGLYNYFKPYKRTQKTLSGDFHISTKLPFEDLREHPAFNTWLMHNGYNVLYNACQTADMVKIGFLSRVRGFTFRGDLQDYIMASAEWKATPFHFRLYFDAFTAKGKTAHVLMIDVDRPNIELGIRFFQQWYNGILTNSPNNLPYMFWPLFKKSYSDEERLKIITDNSHHISNDSVIGLTGLQPPDTLVQLVNGTYTSIRLLLLSVPISGTTTGQLFLQVERQTANKWLLCCFPQQDASKVIMRLGTLEESLKKYVHPDSLCHLFTSSDGLTFTNQVAPLTKGRNKLPRLEVPAHTADYVTQSMQKLYNPTAKRQATEIDSIPPQQPVQTVQVPRPAPTTYATATLPVTPTAPTVVQQLQAKSQEHSNTLAELHQCCANLATSQQQMAKNMAAMNADINSKFSELVSANLKFNDRFNEMSTAIENLRTSSPTRPLKFYKEGNSPLDTMSFHG
jgi:hypothetical protein